MNNKKRIIPVIIVIIIIIVIGISNISFSDNNKQVLDTIAGIEKEEIVEEAALKVDIKGAVNSPGVYDAVNGERVIDIIEKAGGLKSNANTNYINLSKEVSNEMTIWIYTNKEIEKLELGNTIIEYIEKECNCPSTQNSACINGSTSSSSKININTATISELMTLSGIGESKAKLIIEYRDKTPFTSIDDLKSVSGIGESSFEKIKDYITV